MTLDEIDKLNRFEEPDPEGEVCELLWSGKFHAWLTAIQNVHTSPLHIDKSVDHITWHDANDSTLTWNNALTDPSEESLGHGRNRSRSPPVTAFGADVTAGFLRKNDLKVMWDGKSLLLLHEYYMFV